MAVSQIIPVVLFLVAGAFLSIRTKKLTAAGAMTAVIVGFLVFTGGGYTGLAMLTAFFVSGTLATSWMKTEKLQFKAESDRLTERNTWQLLANGGVAAILGLLALLLPQFSALYGLMIAAALASATADTLSSELGMIYGRRSFNIITFSREQKGLDGVVSIEGLLFGLIGSSVIASIYLHGYLWNERFIWIVLTGTIGNLADSVLGVLFERKHYLSNNLVNFLNTLIAALVMFGWLMLA